jgi:hypothetical protein
MQTWATQMPFGMRLKSDGFASNLSCPGNPYTLGAFCAETGRPYDDLLLPVPVEDFVAYGQEFARRCVPTLQETEIVSLDRSGSLFRLQTATGEVLWARNVILATGLSLFQYLPEEFRHLPPDRITHASQHQDFTHFAGRSVTVLGRGASSLNAAVLLHEAGAQVTLVTRSSKIHIHEPNEPGKRALGQRLRHPSTPLGTSLRSWLACASPDLFRTLPARLRRLLVYKHLGPAGGSALEGRVQGFPMLLGYSVRQIEPTSTGSGELRLQLVNAQGDVVEHTTSHVIAGTGYRVDLKRMTFLADHLRQQIGLDYRGMPRLNRNFRSTVRGLHFAGPITAPAFGPLLRFVAGAGFAAERIAGAMKRSYAREQRTAGASGHPKTATATREPVL